LKCIYLSVHKTSIIEHYLPEKNKISLFENKGGSAPLNGKAVENTDIIACGKH
jgi:hypothetical protein